MKKILLSSLAIAAILTTQSCKTDFDTDVSDIKVTSGDADFSKFVSVGNSLTSGYRDGALYTDGQNESFPSIMAQQMQLAGGGEFTQPMMPNNVGGFTDLFQASGGTNFYGKLTLNVVNGNLSPVPSAPEGSFSESMVTGTYNNMGVPGAKSFHLLASGYGNAGNLTAGLANPYFVRFASAPNATVLEDAMAQNPTFFSLWIGNNDVLGYATSGGDGSDSITDTALFAQYYATLTATLTSNGAKGVVANIPNVTSIPFFTTVPYNPVPLDAASATQINTLTTGLKAILTAYGQGDRIQSVAEGSSNPLLIKDESLTDLSAQITAALSAQGMPAQQAGLIGNIFGQARHATSEDLVLLTTSSVIGTSPSTALDATPFNKYGVTYPLEDKHILTATEVSEVLTATEAYNTTIKTNANTYGLAFVDMNAKMIELSQSSGIQFDGVRYRANFVTGGTFSLDGVHLTGRGYAVTANYFIEAINKQYGSTLPLVNANAYSGVTFP